MQIGINRYTGEIFLSHLEALKGMGGFCSFIKGKLWNLTKYTTCEVIMLTYSYLVWLCTRELLFQLIYIKVRHVFTFI